MGQHEVSVMRARRLFDNAPFAYLVTTSNGVVLEANDAAAALLRLRPGGLLKKPIAVLVSLPERHEFRQRMCRCVGGDEVLPWSVTLTPRVSPAVICTATCHRSGDEDRLMWTFHPLSAGPGVEQPDTRPSPNSGSLADELVVALHDAASVEDLLDCMLRRFVPAQSDFCMVELLGREGRLVRCAASHADATRQKYMGDLLADSGPSAVSVDSFTKFATVAPVTPEAVAKLSSNADEHEVWMQLGLETFFRTALIADGQLIGAATLGWTASRQPAHAHIAEMYAAFATASTLLDRALDREVGNCAVQGATSALKGLTRDLAPVLDAILGHAALLKDHEAMTEPHAGSVAHLLRAARHARELVTSAVSDDAQRNDPRVPALDLDAGDLLHETALILGPLAASNDTALEVVTPETSLTAHADPTEARRVLIHLLECAINDAAAGVVRLFARAENAGIVFGFVVVANASQSDVTLSRNDRLLLATARDRPLLDHVRDVLGGSLHSDEETGAVRLWIPMHGGNLPDGT
jgi:PAS domain-containing protein